MCVEKIVMDHFLVGVSIEVLIVNAGSPKPVLHDPPPPCVYLYIYITYMCNFQVVGRATLDGDRLGPTQALGVRPWKRLPYARQHHHQHG